MARRPAARSQPPPEPGPPHRPQRLTGIPASPGVAIGRAFLLDSEEIPITKREIPASNIPQEIARFEEALIQTRREIQQIQEKISGEIGMEHAEIFNAHLMLLEDRALIEEVIHRLKNDLLAVECVFADVLKKYIHAFSKVEDEYLRERTSDLEDVGRRILRNLTGLKRQGLSDLAQPVIVVAYDLSPSDTATMHRQHVIGFVTDIGGRTSHTAIMAKSLEIPAVVGLQVATYQIKPDDIVVVDGTSGSVLINPDSEALKTYEEMKVKLETIDQALLKVKDLPAETPDGHRVNLAANIELPDEIPSVIAHGAQGIGLYRTEFLYLNRADFP
ncbi:MAG: phosphoenolpyruvate--protein phosphotransferase, partial [Candidatus Omnitrophica bacterium]|nr:phosphoenolpyruvate--protein phosphotransferase [Candidatus Omnitrophota bacterium]